MGEEGEWKQQSDDCGGWVRRSEKERWKKEGGSEEGGRNMGRVGKEGGRTGGGWVRRDRENGGQRGREKEGRGR